MGRGRRNRGILERKRRRATWTGENARRWRTSADVDVDVGVGWTWTDKGGGGRGGGNHSLFIVSVIVSGDGWVDDGMWDGVRTRRVWAGSVDRLRFIWAGIWKELGNCMHARAVRSAGVARTRGGLSKGRGLPAGTLYALVHAHAHAHGRGIWRQDGGTPHHTHNIMRSCRGRSRLWAVYEMTDERYDTIRAIWYNTILEIIMK